MNEDLCSAFHEAMLDIYRTAKTECGYNANYFLGMVAEHGGVQAARQLLQSKGISDGLIRLSECGRLDISMEALVLKNQWQSLFTDEELEIARTRLKELEFFVDSLG